MAHEEAAKRVVEGIRTDGRVDVGGATDSGGAAAAVGRAVEGPGIKGPDGAEFDVPTKQGQTTEDVKLATQISAHCVRVLP